MRSENAALIEELRKAEAAKETATEPASPRIATAAAPKPAKTSPAPGTSHKPAVDRAGVAADRKGEHANEAEVKVPAAPMDERAPSTAGAPLVLGAGINPAPQTVDPTVAMDQVPAAEPRFIWFARLRRIPDIFRPAPSASAPRAPTPSVPSIAPRPPLPVGEFVQGAM
jgi:hypothetical protein